MSVVQRLLDPDSGERDSFQTPEPGNIASQQIMNQEAAVTVGEPWMMQSKVKNPDGFPVRDVENFARGLIELLDQDDDLPYFLHMRADYFEDGKEVINYFCDPFVVFRGEMYYKPPRANVGWLGVRVDIYPSRSLHSPEGIAREAQLLAESIEGCLPDEEYTDSLPVL